jgi:hypothetical protein
VTQFIGGLTCPKSDELAENGAILSKGYTNVSNLKGGFGGWVEAGFPTVEYIAQ